MRIGKIDTSERVMVVAEIGNNHEGDYSLAEKMIGAAAEAGVDAVKFQTIVPERLVSPAKRERVEQLRRFQLSYDEFDRLSEVAHKAGVLFLSTPFDVGSVEALEKMVDAYKVSSGDNTFFPLFDRICETGKPIIVSMGLTDWEETKRIRDYVHEKWASLGVEQDLAILHCVCSYPVPDEQANLAVIGKLAELDVTVGYSDHTLGIDAAVLSVALGARIIEKHFTIDKNYSSFRDHQLSADPNDMKELIKRVRQAEAFIGSGEKKVFSCEEGSLSAVRRSIVAAHDLESGHKIIEDDLMWVRPAGGMKPGEESKVVGKVLSRRLITGDLILPEHLKG